LEDYRAIEENEVEACRKDWQRYEERCEKQYKEEMKKFTEMTRFEGEHLSVSLVAGILFDIIRDD